MAEPLLTASGLSKTYPATGLLNRLRGRASVRALDQATLTIGKGARVGIVGESGCGKTTLLRLLLGLERPDAGTVAFQGQPISPDLGLGWYRRHVQLVPQDPSGSLNPHLRVRQSIAEPLECLGVPGNHRERVRDCLDAVGLDPALMERYPGQLSGGQRQRVAIARALAPEPEVIMADEAVSALDASARLHVLRTLRSLCEDLGLTLVFVSHDLGAVNYVCDEVVVMDGGRILESGPVPGVFVSPTHEVTRTLVGAVLPAPGRAPQADRTVQIDRTVKVDRAARARTS